MNPEVDNFIAKAKHWPAELEALRAIVLECGLEENLKWKQPCYAYKGTNVMIMGEFKRACIINFFKGALLQDAEGLLHKPGENTQATRMFEFTSVQEILSLKATIKAYIFEAIAIEENGLKVEMKDNTKLEMVDELVEIFKENKALKTAFEELTPGRQRAYHIHFSGTNNPKTRIDRIEKYTNRILNGKGFNDCVCGLSKKMPGCDGSHKFLDNKDFKL
jgi:uncharacterized protein YdeI (YjbR/CyaY-like superfamily)